MEVFLYFVGVDAHTDLCHSEQSETELKNLRIILLAQRTFGAKILRLPPVALDDRPSSDLALLGHLPPRGRLCLATRWSPLLILMGYGERVDVGNAPTGSNEVRWSLPQDCHGCKESSQ